MKISRRDLLAGASAASLVRSRPGLAWTHGTAAPVVPSGWNTLPLGAGGLITGMWIGPDGKAVCRSDVGGAYAWTGTATLASTSDPSQKWVQLINFTSLGASASMNGVIGAYELVGAPSNSNRLYAIMLDINRLAKWWVYYSTDFGEHWTQSNLSMLNADTNGSAFKNAYYKIAVDPANENVVYCGMPNSSGNSFAVYTTFNPAGGSDGHTFSAFTSGGMGVPTTFGAGVCGICFDPSSGTQVVGGQTVTKRIIIPVGGVDVFESTDGGQTFVSTGAAAAFGTANFSATNATINSNGVFYIACTGINKCWRYSGAGGTWTDITPSAGYGAYGTCLMVDPNNANFLLATGPNGFAAGFISNNAAAGAPPTWAGRTGGEIGHMYAPPYDVGYLNFEGGQLSVNSFVFGTAGFIDSAGVFWMAGAQSIWFITDSSHNAPFIPNYAGEVNVYFTSWGRGQEATVAQDVLCSPGGVYPVMAPQDNGGAMRGTFITYPVDQVIHYEEFTGENLEYAPNDPSFILARITGQGGSFADVTSYSNNYGADGTWTQLAGHARATASAAAGVLTVTAMVPIGTVTGTIVEGAGVWNNGASVFLGHILPYGTGGTTGVGGTGTYALSLSTASASSQRCQFAGGPDHLWQVIATCDVSDGSGGAGHILNVTAIVSGQQIFPGMLFNNSSGLTLVQPYGTSGTTGTGGVGTYILTGSTMLLASADRGLNVNIQGGQCVTTDKDHWLTAPSGAAGPFTIPAVTANGRAANPTWTLANGLPPTYWMMRGWVFGTTSKPFAVGYGADAGTVWAAAVERTGSYTANPPSPSGTVTFYKSTDHGANFSSVGSISISASVTGCYLLSVPGFPQELWFTGNFTAGTSTTAGLWHSTDGGANWTSVQSPAAKPLTQSVAFGAPASPGGYPTMYLVGNTGFGTAQLLYEGQWNTGSLTMTWSLFGPAGADQGASTQLPRSCQFKGILALSGDWNVYQRLYVVSNQLGYAYYTP